MTLKIREICENSWLNFNHTKSFNKFLEKFYCHSREGGNPLFSAVDTGYFPAGNSGMTYFSQIISQISQIIPMNCA